MATTKRDEVIERLDKFLIDRYGKTAYAPSVKAYIADFALEYADTREAELRREIADELTEIYNNPHDKIMGREMMPESISDNILRRVSDYVKELRGK